MQRVLREALAKKHGVSPDHILATAGSTEGLKVSGMVYGGGGKDNHIVLVNSGRMKAPANG